MPDRQYAFDDTINYSVSDTDDIAEFPNQLLYARTICSTIQLWNSRNKTTFDIYFNYSTVKLCTSRLSDTM